MGIYGDSPMEFSESRKDKIVYVELKFLGGSVLASENKDITDSSKTDS